MNTISIGIFPSTVIVPCQWTAWEKDGNCSRPCGPGYQTFTRFKIVVEKDAGRCDNITTKQEDCFLKNCPSKEFTIMLAESILVVLISSLSYAYLLFIRCS